jgi:hypothetical protein
MEKEEVSFTLKETMISNANMEAKLQVRHRVDVSKRVRGITIVVRRWKDGHQASLRVGICALREIAYACLDITSGARDIRICTRSFMHTSHGNPWILDLAWNI